MIRKILAVLAAVATALGLALIGAPGATAATPCSAGVNGAHCYTTIVYDNNGAGYSPLATRLNATMHWTCSTPAALGDWMTTGSLWAGAQDGGTVETGFITPPDGPHPRRIPENYWVRYGGSYGTGLQLWYTNYFVNRNQDYALRINWNGSSWQITRDGTQIGGLSSPTGAIKTMQSGFELADSNNNNNAGRITVLQRVQNAVTYSGVGSGWAGQSIVNAPPYVDPPDQLDVSTVQTHTVGSGVVPCA